MPLRKMSLSVYDSCRFYSRIPAQSHLVISRGTQTVREQVGRGFRWETEGKDYGKGCGKAASRKAEGA